jgi:hypothetical protein
VPGAEVSEPVRDYLDDEATAEAKEAKERERQRRDRYAEVAAGALGEAQDSAFSLLPYEELVRTAGAWYDACAMAMLYSNFSATEQWVRDRTTRAAEQGFQLNDVLALLRRFREVALEKEGWNEDCLTDFDALVDEVIAGLRGKVPWEIPRGLNYITGKTPEQTKADREAEAIAAESGRAAAVPLAERRRRRRNKLQLPIRIRGKSQVGPVDETTHTEDVARNGLYFVTEQPLTTGDTVMVTYPFWEGPGAIHVEYPAEVVRVELKKGWGRGIALKFLVDLGRRDAFPA